MSLTFGNVNLGIGPWTLLWPIVITGFALSFVFVPITTQAYGTLSNEQIGNASGIFNLVRNIGGSIGISVAQTLLTRRADVHQNEIVGSIPASGYWFEQRSTVLKRLLWAQFGPANGTIAGRRPSSTEQVGQQSLAMGLC